MHHRCVPAIAAPLAVGLALGLSATAHAGVATIEWASSVDGSWNSGANWLPMDVPDTPTEMAVLGGRGAYVVTINPGITCNGVSITNPMATLALPGNLSFAADGGDVTNHGPMTGIGST